MPCSTIVAAGKAARSLRTTASTPRATSAAAAFSRPRWGKVPSRLWPSSGETGSPGSDASVSDVKGSIATVSVSGWLAAFALFRLFDVLKPWPIRWADSKVGGGFGMMLDDLIAAGFAIVVLQGALWLGVVPA